MSATELFARDPRADIFEVVCRMLAERGGEALLGDVADAESGELAPGVAHAVEVFVRSLIGSSYPNFWFECPLSGAPGFDLHVYFDRADLAPGDRFAEGGGFGYQPAFDWYIERETSGIGLGFAHDLASGKGGEVALYTNVNKAPLANQDGLFEAVGRPETGRQFRILQKSLPASWDVWYIGLFADRPGSPVRAGSFVSNADQRAYAEDISLLERHLRAAGFEAIDGRMLEILQRIARLPVAMEIQIDRREDGSVSDTLPVSLGPGLRGPAATRAFFESGAGAELGRMMEELGVADERWRRIPDISLAKLLPLPALDGRLHTFMVISTPGFIKLKWDACELRPAKVYQQCQISLPPSS